MTRTPETIARPADLAEALALLTRLPAPPHRPRGAAAAWAWPVAGLAVALVVGLVAALGLRFGLPPGLVAGLALATQVGLTGALHEDGLADTADGFWGGATVERRLEIMKDSRIGSYGVVALILSLGLRWTALAHLFAAGTVFGPVIAAAVLSRSAMAAVMAVLPGARSSGLSAHVGRPSPMTVALATAIALGLGLGAAGAATLTAFAWLAVSTVGLGRLARRRIGGQTGDVLGAAQQIGEIVVLVTFARLV